MTEKRDWRDCRDLMVYGPVLLATQKKVVCQIDTALASCVSNGNHGRRETELRGKHGLESGKLAELQVAAVLSGLFFVEQILLADTCLDKLGTDLVVLISEWYLPTLGIEDFVLQVKRDDTDIRVARARHVKRTGMGNPLGETPPWLVCNGALDKQHLLAEICEQMLIVAGLRNGLSRNEFERYLADNGEHEALDLWRLSHQWLLESRSWYQEPSGKRRRKNKSN